MNKKKKVSILLGVALLVIIIIACIITIKPKQQAENASKDKKDLVVKQEVKVSEVEKDKIEVNKEYKVENVNKENDKISLEVAVSLDDANAAYGTGRFLVDSFKELNKDKMAQEGIKNVEIVLKGKDKSWIFDGSENIKEIEFK